MPGAPAAAAGAAPLAGGVARAPRGGNNWCVLLATGRVDKLDSSFSRSRSSSMSSLENISQEAIQCLAFADSYTKKSGQCDYRASFDFLYLV